MKPAAEQLQRLKVAIQAGRPVPADVGAWLLCGLERFETQTMNEKIEPLCKCLDLRPAGRKSIPYRRQLTDRNAALRDALRHLPNQDLTDRDKCRELLSAIRRIESVGWLRIKTRPMAALSPELQADLLRTADAARLPETVNGLFAATRDQTRK